MLTAGVDVGGSKVVAIVLDADARTLGRARMKTPTTGDRVDVLDVVTAAIHEAVDNAGVAVSDLGAVGVGSPGVVVEGTVGGATNVPGWFERFALQKLIEERVSRPVRIVNDTNAAAVGEHRLGAGRGHDDVLLVTTGTGVGGGLVLGGRPYEGKFGGAGEFGHTVVVRGGALCPCGRRGCVEAYAGRRAMAQAVERAAVAGTPTMVLEIMRKRGKRRPTSGTFREAFDMGDPLVADLIDEAVGALGVGIASAVNLLDVELVVIGGGMSDKFAPFFIHRIEAAARPNLFLQPPHVRFVAAELGDAAGAVGAALLARDPEAGAGDGGQ